MSRMDPRIQTWFVVFMTATLVALVALLVLALTRPAV